MNVIRKRLLILSTAIAGLLAAAPSRAIVLATGSGTGATSLFDGVGTLTFPSQPSFSPGSATLIDPLHVLTIGA